MTTYLIEWRELRGRTRETYVSARDAIAARATVTSNPDVARIVDITPMRMPEVSR